MSKVANIFCYPEQPQAGEIFRLLVTLNDAAGADVTVLLEKQRLVASNGGFPELRPTGSKYFDKPPQPIKVSKGEKIGFSEPIVVKKNAQAEIGEPPVRFPEQVLFSGYVGQLSEGFASVLTTISGQLPD
jgi:hypothetical protein